MRKRRRYMVHLCTVTTGYVLKLKVLYVFYLSILVFFLRHERIFFYLENYIPKKNLVDNITLDSGKRFLTRIIKIQIV